MSHRRIFDVTCWLSMITDLVMAATPPRRGTRRLALLAFLVMTACGPREPATRHETKDNGVSTSKQALNGGSWTPMRPEIGRFWRNGGPVCTATLIAPRYVLTSARCVSFSDAVYSTDLVDFSSSNGSQYLYTLSEIYLFSRYLNTGVQSGYGGDLALLRLSSPVPASVAVGAPISQRLPVGDSRETKFGYGCNTSFGDGSHTKRFVELSGPYQFSYCDDLDLGGPIAYGSLFDVGPVWGLINGYAWDLFKGGYFDLVTDVGYHDRQIEGLLHAYEGDFEDEMDRYGGDYASFGMATASSCQSRCMQDGDRCRAWTFVKPPPGGSTGTCYLKFSAGDLVARAGVVSGLNPTRLTDNIQSMEVNVDRPGGDYTHFTVSFPGACATACAQDSRCLSYAVAGLGASQQTCWLKNQVPPAVPGVTGVGSAVRRGLEMNTVRYGADLRSFQYSMASPEYCQAECEKDSQCNSWNYLPAGPPGQWNAGVSTCFLKWGTPAQNWSKYSISGVKNQVFH